MPGSKRVDKVKKVPPRLRPAESDRIRWQIRIHRSTLPGVGQDVLITEEHSPCNPDGHPAIVPFFLTYSLLFPRSGKVSNWNRSGLNLYKSFVYSHFVLRKRSWWWTRSNCSVMIIHTTVTGAHK